VDVWRQAVDLHDARVALSVVKGCIAREREVEQPAGCRRADVHLEVAPTRRQRIDYFDDARGVAEAVSGDVEDDGR
jgi:hypothetical protein